MGMNGRKLRMDNSPAAASLSSILFLLATLVLLVHSYRQEVVLYESFDDDGNFHTYRTHMADASFLGSSIKRFCVRGTWVFYSDRNYETYTYYALSSSAVYNCMNITALSIGSFRYGGANETEISAASFYPRAYFAGPEILVTGIAAANLGAHSYIITGATSWTLYSGDNFDGNHKCVTPPPDRLTTFMSSPPTGWTVIGSAAQGCQPFMLNNATVNDP